MKRSQFTDQQIAFVLRQAAMATCHGRAAPRPDVTGTADLRHISGTPTCGSQEQVEREKAERGTGSPA